jgi:dipeptidyl aminopeptidase/acylaminoacyl peptidase
VRSQAWLLSPVHQRASGAPPCVLNIHGGPHGAYGWAYNFLVQVQSAPEWALIIGNPPGSLTYGEAFAQLTHKAWGEADFPHVMAYCDEAVKQGLADEDKLAIAGGSYGGFLTTWAIGHTDRFKAACAQRPPTKLDSIFGSSEFGWALMHSCFGVHPWEDPELYRRLSPVTYAERINTPLRLIGCTEDYRVPMEQVEQLYITLKVLGRPVDLVVFRESHHLVYGGKPWSRAGHAQAVREWLERYL